MDNITEDGGLKRLFNKQTFDQDKYVKNIVREGEVEINKTLHHINKMTEETSSLMKKAIFTDYSLFIDAAKAVYQLESSMHQMHHHLKEQKRLLNGLGDIRLYSDQGTSTLTPQSTTAEEKIEDDSRNSLASLLERVEGSSSVAAVPGRRVLFEGDIKELDSENYTPLQTIRVFLMNDAFLVATKLQQRRGPIRYRFQALYELDSVAVVNIREREGQDTPSRAFKIMVFPDTRIFQTETSKEKKEWMDAIDKAKRQKASDNSRKRESTIISPSPSSNNPFEDLVDGPQKIKKRQAPQPNNPFLSSSPPSQPISKPPAVAVPSPPATVFTLDAWLLEAPENLDVCLAERNLTEAVKLIEQIQSRLAELSANLSSDNPPTSRPDVGLSAGTVSGASSGTAAKLSEFRSRIDQRVTLVTEMLHQELVTGAERHGGVRSVRQAVTQLIRLGKSSLACQLFLNYRSGVVHHRLQQVKQEGSQNIYVGKLSFAFHRAVFETGYEFKKIFDSYKRFTPRFCAWCTEEVEKFASKLNHLLVESRSVSFYTMALTMEHVHAHSEKVTEHLGVDLTFNLNNALQESWQRAAEDQTRVLKDALDWRASSEEWHRLHFSSPKEADKFFKEMRESKIEGIETYVASNHRVNLTDNTCQFAKSIMLFAESLARLKCQELFFVFTECVASILKAELKHYRRVLGSQQFVDKRNFIVGNLGFLSTSILPRVEKYLSCAECPGFLEVKQEMQYLLDEGKGFSV